MDYGGANFQEMRVTMGKVKWGEKLEGKNVEEMWGCIRGCLKHMILMAFLTNNILTFFKIVKKTPL